MNRELPAWVGRVAALLLLMAVLAVPYVFVLAPLRDAYRVADADLLELQDQMARVERIAATRPALEQQLAEVAQAAAPQQLYLAGETDALAAAALQAELQSLVAANGGQLRSIQVLPAKEAEGFRRVGLRVEFSAPLAGLFPLIHRLEAGTPYLFLEDLDIEAPPASASGAKPTAEPILSASFGVMGYLPPATP